LTITGRGLLSFPQVYESASYFGIDTCCTRR
jgi:hypothetical protein